MKKILAVLLTLFCAPAAAQNYLRDDGIFHSVVEGTTNGQLLANVAGNLGGINIATVQTGLPIALYGAKCDDSTDDTVAIQAAWTAAAAANTNVWLGGVGTGVCKISSLTQPTPTGSGKASFLTGPGSGAVKLSSTVIGTSCAITVTATYGVTSYVEGAFSGFELEQRAHAQDGYGFCVSNLTKGTWLDVKFSWFFRGFSGVDTTSIVFQNSTFFNNQIGAYGAKSTISPPNDWVFIGNKFQTNGKNAISLTRANVANISFNEFQANGYNFGQVPTGTIDLVGPPESPGLGANIINNYFEGNVGTAEIRINQNSVANLSSTYNINNNNFARVSADPVTGLAAGVYLLNSGTGTSRATINVGGNNFYDNSGVSAGFLWLSAQTSATTNYVFNCVTPNTADIAVELPIACRAPAANTVPVVDTNAQYTGYSAVPLAAITTVPATTLLGNPAGSTGILQSITIGNPFILSGGGTTLSTSAFTGDVTTPNGSFNTTLATVNSNVGSFGDGTHVGQFTVNAKGLITAASSVVITGAAPTGAAGGSLTGTYPNPALSTLVSSGSVGSATVVPILTYNIEGRLTVISSATITPAIGSITGLGTGIATALAINTGSAGAPVLFNGAGGTPSSITLTNGSGLPTTGLTGTLQAAQEPAHTGDVTNSAGSLALAIAANAVTNAKLATMLTNTVKGNATSGTAVPTDLTMTSCSTASSAVTWTTNTGFNCNTAITASTMPTTGLTGTLQAAQEPAHTGDVTNTAGSLALAIAANAVTLAKLATQATNTVLANATSGTAVPTALAVSSCDTATKALQWTTNTGFACNSSINAATLGGATFAAPGAIGGGTASTGAFTTLTASSTTTIGPGGTGTTPAAVILNGGSGAGGGSLLQFQTNSSNDWLAGTVSAITAAGTSKNFRFQRIGVGVGMEIDATTLATSFVGSVSSTAGFIANGNTGITTVCTVAVGNVLTFTLGILTAKGGVAGCT